MTNAIHVLAATPPQLLPARELMAFTLAAHILLVPFGVALPALTLLMHYRGLRRGDEVALRLARRWSAVMAVQFAIGIVTGTVLSFEFGLLWPGMMGRWGDVFGLAFGIEGWEEQRQAPRRDGQHGEVAVADRSRPLVQGIRNRDPTPRHEPT